MTGDWGDGDGGVTALSHQKGRLFRQLREICRLHKGDITEEAFILLWQPEKHSSSVVRNPLRTIDFFSVILCPKTLNTIPMMVLRAIRGEGSKTQVYVSSSFFVCLKVGPKKKKKLRSPTSGVHILLSSVIPRGMKVVFVFQFL